MIKILVEIAWHLGLLHIPAYDNTRSPWQEEDSTQDEGVPQLETQDNVRSYNYGTAEYGKEQKVIALQEAQTQTEDGFEYDYTRYDGSGTHDYREWHWTDDEATKGLTDHQRKMYQLVRLNVIQGHTNARIAQDHGYKIRWAEEHAGRVRAAFREREKAERTTPTPAPGEGLYTE
jgi:hypothetical protein